MGGRKFQVRFWIIDMGVPQIPQREFQTLVENPMLLTLSHYEVCATWNEWSKPEFQRYTTVFFMAKMPSCHYSFAYEVVASSCLMTTTRSWGRDRHLKETWISDPLASKFQLFLYSNMDFGPKNLDGGTLRSIIGWDWKLHYVTANPFMILIWRRIFEHSKVG